MTKKPDLVTRYEVITQKDPNNGDLILPIPQPVLDRLNWKEGDSLDISLDKNGKIYLKKM
jgi:AbrB family looped-hinge helix DNA binding protein